VVVDLTARKVGDQIKWADKHAIPYVLIIGEDEVKNNIFKVKELASGQEHELHSVQAIAELINKK
jgi:histidyl-tRNA synthetase